MYFNSFSVYYQSEAMTLQNENSRINTSMMIWTALRRACRTWESRSDTEIIIKYLAK